MSCPHKTEQSFTLPDVGECINVLCDHPSGAGVCPYARNRGFQNCPLRRGDVQEFNRLFPVRYL